MVQSRPRSTRIHRIIGFADRLDDPPDTWRSPIYRSLTPIDFDGAAWELLGPRLSRNDAVRYDLDLLIWTSDRNPDRDPPRWIVLASGATLETPRHREGLGIAGAIAYQLEMRSLGGPRLSTVHLLERALRPPTRV